MWRSYHKRKNKGLADIKTAILGHSDTSNSLQEIWGNSLIDTRNSLLEKWGNSLIETGNSLQEMWVTV